MTYSYSINLFYTNATSLVNKWSEFNDLLAFHDFPQIAMVTETWFNVASISNLPGYTTYLKNREYIRGGGVAIFIRNDVKSHRLTFEDLSGDTSEQLWCTIEPDNCKPVLIGCIYRLPDSSTSNGDFNYADIIWST